MLRTGSVRLFGAAMHRPGREASDDDVVGGHMGQPRDHAALREVDLERQAQFERLSSGPRSSKRSRRRNTQGPTARLRRGRSLSVYSESLSASSAKSSPVVLLGQRELGVRICQRARRRRVGVGAGGVRHAAEASRAHPAGFGQQRGHPRAPAARAPVDGSGARRDPQERHALRACASARTPDTPRRCSHPRARRSRWKRSPGCRLRASGAARSCSSGSGPAEQLA